jgi:hypothetical protein
VGLDPQGSRGLAPHDHPLFAVRSALAGLETQAGVPTGEALDVGERVPAPFLVVDEQEGDLAEARCGRRVRRTVGQGTQDAEASTTPPFMSIAPDPDRRPSRRVSGRWAS